MVKTRVLRVTVWCSGQRVISLQLSILLGLVSLKMKCKPTRREEKVVFSEYNLFPVAFFPGQVRKCVLKPSPYS